MKIPANEIGFSLCRTRKGGIVLGPVSQGSPTRVDITVACPLGTQFTGLFHTHPRLPGGQGGIAQLSSTDVKSAQRVGADVACVGTANALRCFRIRK